MPAPSSRCTNTSPPRTTNRPRARPLPGFTSRKASPATSPARAWSSSCKPRAPTGRPAFVGIERITGAVGGRAGTFLLQDAGTVQGNIVSGDWFVIPGSGTGQLAGLRGEGGFRANLGEGAQVHLDYWFD